MIAEPSLPMEPPERAQGCHHTILMLEYPKNSIEIEEHREVWSVIGVLSYIALKRCEGMPGGPNRPRCFSLRLVPNSRSKAVNTRACPEEGVSGKESEATMLNFNREHFQKPGLASDRRLLLGIDAPLTAATWHALHTIGEFFAPYSVHVHLLLLSVIPVPYVRGRYVPLSSLPPTTEQRKQAAEALQQASAALQEYGMTRSHIETLIHIGSPPDELVKVATQQHVDCLIIGSWGRSPLHWLRRILMGSTSQCILRHASCPVMVVTLPRSTRPGDLVAWYETAIRQVLCDHPTELLNVTAADVVGRFPLPHVSTTGREKWTAATQALERLASSGVLYRYTVQGEAHYLND